MDWWASAWALGVGIGIVVVVVDDDACSRELRRTNGWMDG